MMRNIIYALLIFSALILAPLVANYLMEDNGYVLVRFHEWALEMSVPAMIIVLVVLYFLLRLAGILWRGTWGIGKAAREIRKRQAQKRMTNGLIQISEGNWLQGERLLIRSAGLSETPLLNYLGAARAAQLQGAYDRRDRWLQLAYDNEDAATTAVLLTQAELQLERDQHEQALATLRKLEEIAPGNEKGLGLLAHLYAHLGEWRQLTELMPRLQKNRNLPQEKLAHWSRQAHAALFLEAGASSNSEEVQRTWKQLPRFLRKNKDIVRAYVLGLCKAGNHALAATTIKNQLKREWDPELVALYGELELDDASRQLAQTESWLKTRANDPVLLLAAAKLAIRNKLWGKARSYLEASIAMQPTVQSYDTYGRLLEQLGETSLASDAFRKGLALATVPSTSVVATPADRGRADDDTGATA